MQERAYGWSPWHIRRTSPEDTSIPTIPRPYCPYCNGRKVWPGFNDLKTTNPEIAKEWNYEKNADVTPSDIKSGSNIKVWWKCINGHEWEAKVNERVRGRGCPYCSGRKIMK